MPERDADELLAIGRLGAPKGVRGDLKLQSYSGETAHFLVLKKARLRHPDSAGAGTAASGPLELKVQRVGESGSGLIIAFVGYDSPEKARALTGMELVAPRAECAPLKDNEWYIADLVGLSLVVDGRVLATVRSVLEGGPDPWLEVVRTGKGSESGQERGSSEGAEERGSFRTAKRNPEGISLVPFRKEFVGAVDLGAGTIELLAPYLLDE